MAKWEYLWRRTYWVERERSGDYVEWISYNHVWKDIEGNEAAFPDEDGLNQLGAAGWELVSVSPTTAGYVTRISPQQGESYSQLGVFVLVFKRRVD